MLGYKDEGLWFQPGNLTSNQGTPLSLGRALPSGRPLPTKTEILLKEGLERGTKMHYYPVPQLLLP